MSLPIMDNLGVTFKNEKERKEFFSDRVKNHAALQSQINEPFNIDYNVFKKSPEEKVEHANAKLVWRRKHS